MAEVVVEPTRISWQPQVAFEHLFLIIKGPDGLELRRAFEPGHTPALDLNGAIASLFADGAYTYEVILLAPLPETATADDAGGGGEQEPEPRVRRIVQTGSFSVEAGVLTRRMPAGEAVALDQVVADDQIIQGSLCVGFDCVNGETFSFDTIRLKENNLRLFFHDTSASATFPNRDWQIRINDSASGGLNAFFIDDMGSSNTGGGGGINSTPFTIEAGASTHALYIDSSSRIGFRTNVPILDLHANSSNTPGLRLEQNGNSGWSPQTWDVAANEANFFIRDATNGSLLPFRIRPGAPTSSLDIAANGDVGLGTASPAAALHVRRSFSPADTAVKVVSVGTADTTLLSVDWRGNLRIAGAFTGTFAGDIDPFALNLDQNYTSSDTPFSIVDNEGTAGTGDDVTLLSVDGSGAMTSSASLHFEQDYTAADVPLRIRDTGGFGSTLMQVNGSGDMIVRGDLAVSGTLSKGGGSFKIDHPLDPENKYLAHSFVESPDMMNVYNGNVTTDPDGYATIALPDYFEALNRDFRYQLTVIGTFAQAIVAEEIQDNRFVIRTNQPSVKVSWQVTGIRHDPWAEAHRIQVEAEKPAAERGAHLYPEVYRQPNEP